MLGTNISGDAAKAIGFIDEFKVISFLRNLVKIPSYLGQEVEKANYVTRELERMGVEIVDTILGPSTERRNVLGIIRGTGGGKSILCGAHLDTCWPVEGQEEIAHEAIVKDGKIYGLGVGDSMTAMAAFLGAIDAIKRSGVQLKGDAIFLFSVDELGPKKGALLLEESRIKADMCLIGETTGDFDIGVTHSGKVEVEITVRGMMQTLLQGYGEKAGLKVVNAVNAMARVISYLEQMVAEEPYFHQKHPRLPGEGAAFYIGPIVGGNTGYGSPYVRPGREHGLASPPAIWCKLRCGCRYWPGQTPEEFVNLVKKWVEKARAAYPGFEASVECYLEHGNTPIDTPEDAEIVRILQKTIPAVTGRKPNLIGCVYSTEGPFYERAGAPTAWTAPGSLRMGRPDEHVTIKELIDCCKIYTATVVEACNLPKA